MPFRDDENWYDGAKLQRLIAACERVRPLDGAVIEIGCWEGRSTVAMAMASFPEIVHAVDHWLGTPGDDTGKLAATRDVYADFRANIDELTQGNVHSYRMDWRDFAEWWGGRPIRLIHLDADHSYGEVREQIRRFAPLIVPNGILCGDDYDMAKNGGVVRAVQELHKPVISPETAFWYWVKP